MFLYSNYFIRIIQKPIFWFVLICAFTLLYFIQAHEGMLYHDDHSYATYANQLLHGQFHLDGMPFSHRFMVFGPTALSYALLGVNVYTTTLWPLCCTLGTYFLLYLTFHKSHPNVCSWLLVLLGFYYFLLNTSNALFPDNIVLFFSTACLLLLYQARGTLSNKKKEVRFGLLFSCSLFLAFLSKETIVYAFPFFVWLCLYQFWHRQNLLFWTVIILSSLALFSSLGFLYHKHTGNAFQRIQDIETYSAHFKQSYLQARNHQLLARLTYQPVLFFINSGLAVPLILASTACTPFNKHSSTNLHNPTAFWLIASFTMLAGIWLGSVSLNHYKPMELEPRMFHPLVPAFCVAAAFAITLSWENRFTRIWILALFSMAFVISTPAMKLVYGPLSLFVIVSFIYKPQLPQQAALFLVALVSMARPLYYMAKPTSGHYFELEKMLQNRLHHSTGKYLVLADSTLLVYHSFMYGFAPPKNYMYKGYAAFQVNQMQSADSVFVLINSARLPTYLEKYKPAEHTILSKLPKLKLIHQEGEYVKLYWLPSSKSYK